MEGEALQYGRLEMPDLWIIGLYLALSVGLGIWFVKRGTKDTQAYFVGSGAIPWWVAGTSLLVACFAADTPLWVGKMVYQYGLDGLWMYWAPAVGTAFFIMMIAPLWKRSGVTTDIEFLEFRYSGNAASAMRFINSIFYSGFVSIMWMTLQTLSMVMILQAVTPWPKIVCVIIVVVFAGSYSVISGLWGVASSGAMQFLITYVGSVIVAIYAVTVKVGGVTTLVEQIKGMSTTWPQGSELNILPTHEALGTPLALPVALLAALFFCRFFEQAGMGQYVAQRVIATKDTRAASYTALIWGFGFFAIVPLPWIVTVIAAKVVMPNLAEGYHAYPKMAMLLPTGLKGILIASMLAAFMSTYSSLMSWGSSYAINDFYRRFLVKKASEKHYVRGAQLFMVFMAVVSAYFAMGESSLIKIILTVLEFMAGYWTVMVIRWLWWRVNAWAEVTAMVASIGTAFSLRIAAWGVPKLDLNPDGIAMKVLGTFAKWGGTEGEGIEFAGQRMFTVLFVSLFCWVTVMFLTKAPNQEHIDNFYRKVQPPGFWGPVRKRLKMKAPIGLLGIGYCWLVMVLGIYLPLVGLIKMSFGNIRLGLPMTVGGIIAVVLAIKKLRSLYGHEKRGH